MVQEEDDNKTVLMTGADPEAEAEAEAEPERAAPADPEVAEASLYFFATMAQEELYKIVF